MKNDVSQSSAPDPGQQRDVDNPAFQHDNDALAEILSKRDSHRQMPLFVTQAEWIMGLSTEMGKVAASAEHLHYNCVAEENLRTALIRLAGLSLAWLDELSAPIEKRSSGGMLVRAIENGFPRPRNYVEEEISEKS